QHHTARRSTTTEHNFIDGMNRGDIMTATPGAKDPRSVRPDTRRILVGASALALAAGMAAAYTGPAQAQGATVTSTSVYGATITVTSSKHHKLHLSTSISKGTLTSAIYLRVSVATPNNAETHSWSFQLPPSTWNIGATGSGKIKVTSKQLGGFGSL